MQGFESPLGVALLSSINLVVKCGSALKLVKARPISDSESPSIKTELGSSIKDSLKVYLNLETRYKRIFSLSL